MEKTIEAKKLIKNTNTDKKENKNNSNDFRSGEKAAVANHKSKIMPWAGPHFLFYTNVR